MSLSKKVRAELRRRCPTPEETDALLDAHDERDRYRALLAGYVGVLDELARVHDALGYPTEASDYRGKAHHIESALEGK